MSWEGAGFLRVAQDTNWVAVSMSSPTLVALKADGSLWKWNPAKKSTAEYSQIPPTRLGIHNDWVALADAGGGAVALAADGSLWLWTNDREEPFALLKFPKQPKFLGNVFSGSKSGQTEGLRTESRRGEHRDADAHTEAAVFAPAFWSAPALWRFPMVRQLATVLIRPDHVEISSPLIEETPPFTRSLTFMLSGRLWRHFDYCRGAL